MERDDLPAVMDTARQVFNRPFERNAYLVTLGRSSVSPIVAQIDGVPVGHLIYENLDGHKHIIEIAVDKAHQGKGIGTALFDNLKGRVSKDPGRHSMVIEVRESQLEATHLVEDLGFKQYALKRDLNPEHGGDAQWFRWSDSEGMEGFKPHIQGREQIFDDTKNLPEIIVAGVPQRGAKTQGGGNSLLGPESTKAFYPIFFTRDKESTAETLEFENPLFHQIRLGGTENIETQVLTARYRGYAIKENRALGQMNYQKLPGGTVLIGGMAIHPDVKGIGMVQAMINAAKDELGSNQNSDRRKSSVPQMRANKTGF